MLLERLREHTTTASGVLSPLTGEYDVWLKVMKRYQEVLGYDGHPKANFWLVVGLPANDFSNQIEFHPYIPMLVLTSG